MPSVPKSRKSENKIFPEGWRWKNGAIRYRVPVGMEHLWDGKTEFKLGTTAPEAYREWTKRMGEAKEPTTVGALLDRYAIQIIPKKAPATQTGNMAQMKFLRAVFGHMPLHSVEPKDIYAYFDKRGRVVNAKREIALLSHAYTKAVEWGCIAQHPFKGEVRIEGRPPRSRYAEDWEIVECLTLSPPVPMIQAYIRLKLLLGLRKSDMLGLKEKDLKEDGIHVTPRKTSNSTGKRIVYEWTDELRRAVALVKAARRVDISPYLFCTRRGKGYINEVTGRTDGFDSVWQRFMARVLKETKVTTRFTEHDLRAKVGSDAESNDRAKELLAHADGKITQRVYRRKPQVIRPAR